MEQTRYKTQSESKSNKNENVGSTILLRSPGQVQQDNMRIGYQPVVVVQWFRHLPQSIRRPRRSQTTCSWFEMLWTESSDPEHDPRVQILIDRSSRTLHVNAVNAVGYGKDDALAVPPLQESETAPRGELAENPEKEMVHYLHGKILLLMAGQRSHFDSEMVGPMHIESYLLGLVEPV